MHNRLPLYLRLYPYALLVVAIGGFAVCQWFHIRDLKTRGPANDMSLKYILSAVPQFFTALLLLYYGCTFHRASSAIVHQLLVESCLHQSVVLFLLGSISHTTFHLSISLCCSFPQACPVSVQRCQFAELFQCPKRLESMQHYDLYPRLAHALATWLLVLALTSISSAHTMRQLALCVRRAEFLTLPRRMPLQPASPSIRL